MQADFPSVTGTGAANDLSISFEAYVPEIDAIPANILDPNTGSSETIGNSVGVTGLYLLAPVAANSSTVNLSARSVAVQKSRAIAVNVGNGGFTPGDTIEFTINFQVSDYFTLNQLVIEDLLGDG